MNGAEAGLQPTDAGDQRDAKPCTHCGGAAFAEWEVTAAGGTSPRLVPLPVLHNPTCRIRCCLACGRLEWFVSPDTLVDLRAKFATGAPNV